MLSACVCAGQFGFFESNRANGLHEAPDPSLFCCFREGWLQTRTRHRRRERGGLCWAAVFLQSRALREVLFIGRYRTLRTLATILATKWSSKPFEECTPPEISFIRKSNSPLQLPRRTPLSSLDFFRNYDRTVVHCSRPNVHATLTSVFF